jgi:hypothetical protein
MNTTTGLLSDVFAMGARTGVSATPPTRLR